MPKAKVAIVRTKPETVLADYHRAMNLAGYQDVIKKDADTGLKVNISWHFFYPAASTTPWQLEGVIASSTSVSAGSVPVIDSTKRRSRSVTMPTSAPPSSTGR